jgi:hypothetical protein
MKRVRNAECRMQNEMQKAVAHLYFILHSAFCTPHFP